MKYTCMIVDDERPALQLLTAYLTKLPHLQLVATCEDALQAMAALQQQTVDMLILDIQMPGFTGLELIRVLKEKPQIILTTAYREYAVEGFALDATDYLVKPFSFERFAQAINRATEQINLKRSESPPSAAPAPDAEPKGRLDHFFAKTHHKLEKVAFDEVEYVESLREYAAIYTANKRYVVSQTMRKLEEEFPVDRFIRVHRSYIVSLSHIDEIYGNTIVLNGKEIPIGGSYRKAFFEKVKML
ncbi:MAG: LytTR family DNA-binding domain-containing protein [Bacteroidota bacterium]